MRNIHHRAAITAYTADVWCTAVGRGGDGHLALGPAGRRGTHRLGRSADR